MNRIKQDSDEPAHTHIHVEEVSGSKMKDYLTHALADRDVLERMVLIGPDALVDYQRLDPFIRPLIDSIMKETGEPPELSLVNGHLIDELIRLSQLEDEESKKKVEVLREILGNANYLYRVLGAGLKKLTISAHAGMIISSISEDQEVKDKMAQGLFEAALMGGGHIRKSLVLSTQQLDDAAANMAAIAWFLFDGKLKDILKRLVQENTEESKAEAIMLMFASVLLTGAVDSFSEVYKFEIEKLFISPELKELLEKFMARAFAKVML